MVEKKAGGAPLVVVSSALENTTNTSSDIEAPTGKDRERKRHRDSNTSRHHTKKPKDLIHSGGTDDVRTSVERGVPPPSESSAPGSKLSVVGVARVCRSYVDKVYLLNGFLFLFPSFPFPW